MKKIFKLLFVSVFAAGTLTSCSDDDDNSSLNNSAAIAAVVNTAQSGTWHITSYIEAGNDETNHFAGYDFTFGNNGVLTAVNNITVTGAWSVTSSDNSSDDSPDDNDLDFNIVFTSPVPAEFLDLTDDWEIVQVTATTISLIDVSGGNGGTDTLVFEKNN
jgi:hypothetical protein